jgi:hypothetical protein
MGYCMDMQDCKFHIPAAHFADALAAIKALMHNTEAMTGGSWSGGVMVERWYSWVNTNEVLEAETLSDALAAWRWEAHLSENGDVTYLYFRGEKSGQDDVLFRAIAPYVTSGSYVCMRGEDGALWRWYFDGSRCVEQEGKVFYE